VDEYYICHPIPYIYLLAIYAEMVELILAVYLVLLTVFPPAFLCSNRKMSREIVIEATGQQLVAIACP